MTKLGLFGGYRLDLTSVKASAQTVKELEKLKSLMGAVVPGSGRTQAVKKIKPASPDPLHS